MELNDIRPKVMPHYKYNEADILAFVLQTIRNNQTFLWMRVWTIWNFNIVHTRMSLKPCVRKEPQLYDVMVLRYNV